MSEKKLFHEVPKSANFHSAVLTTYSFDFHHFESQVLRPLKRKGITNVNVFADTAMLDQSIGFSTGHLKYLSTSYSINGIPCLGAFHPKITILAGEKDILLLQGSGNITNGGHGKNHEIFNVFYANKEDQTQLPLIQEAWNYILQLTDKIQGLSAEKLEWVSNNCDLLNKKKSDSHIFHELSDDFSAALVYNDTTSIWNQVQNLIPANTIKNIKVFSPFYDQKGTFLNRLSTHFANSSIDAFLQPDKGIHPHKMDGQKNIQFLSWESTERASETVIKFDRKLHSKIFWFDAGVDQYGLFGSPNATVSAFGTDDKRGANDEFAVLIKVTNKDILKELGLTGQFKTWKPQEVSQVEAIEKDAINEQSCNTKKIKLLGVDQDGKRITLFIKYTAAYKIAEIVFYNNWGIELERFNIKLNSTKLKLELSDNKSINTIAFAQFVNNEGDSISNKQIVNSLHELWNTNPSIENRKLMKLGSMLESGSNKIFDVINFFNDLKSANNNSDKNISRGSGSTSDKEDKPAAAITYEDAIALSKEPKEHQHFLKQHNSIKIWDAIERYFKELATAEEEEDMNDEEEADANKGRQRKEKKQQREPVPLNSVKVLNSRRRSIEKFLNNYLKGLKKSSGTEGYKIGLMDMAMFLIVMKHLLEFTERQVIFKIESDDEEERVLYPFSGNLSELSSFSGAILNLLGHFVNLLCHAPFQEIEDEYSAAKLLRYKLLVKRSALFSLALIKEKYKYHEKGKAWSDILALNIIDRLGKPEKNFEKHLDELLVNTSITVVDSLNLTGHITNWSNTMDNRQMKNDRFYNDQFGLCQIIKQIPLNGDVKYLKLGRPGFEYNNDQKDFLLPKLYDYETGELIRSLQRHRQVESD
ncbi:hypothetical protein N9K15_02130 [Maribacter arcticus]|nr:hypothetical protein [Maribacter arcticus]MDA9089721.1 hypothetical protein [Maribacter arcticus]